MQKFEKKSLSLWWVKCLFGIGSAMEAAEPEAKIAQNRKILASFCPTAYSKNLTKIYLLLVLQINCFLQFFVIMLDPDLHYGRPRD